MRDWLRAQEWCVPLRLSWVGLDAVRRPDGIGGAEARERATVAVEDDGEWFDRAIRAQELRKYPPAGSCSGFRVTAACCGGSPPEADVGRIGKTV